VVNPRTRSSLTLLQMLDAQLVPPRPIDPLLLITRDSPLLSRDTSESTLVYVGTDV
jgi:hypothetical protein